MIVAAGRHHDLVHAEKAAHRGHPPLVRRIGAQQQQRQRHRGRDLPAVAARQQRDQRRQTAQRADDIDALLFDPCERRTAAERERDQCHRQQHQQHPVPAHKVRPALAERRTAQRRQHDQDGIFGDP